MSTNKSTRRDFLKAVGLCASGIAVSGCSAPVRRAAYRLPAEKPNILWITCEDVSSPYLGCYGDIYAKTPNIDRLADESVLYSKTFATAPVCAPSRSCLVTGVYATSTGTQHLRSDVKLPSQIKCFPEYLRAAGYYCTNNYKKDYNFEDVNVWDESSETAHWRKRKPGQPFFSVFNFTSTHQGQINGSDEEFFDKYTSTLKPAERHEGKKIPLPPYYPDTPFVRKIWTRYYNLITYMDKQVGDLLGQLKTDGLADNTIVFFFSDHGLGLPRFKRTLYDSGLHVPLIIRFGRRYQHFSPLKTGRRTDRLVSFVDFAPTVLSLTGLPIPHYMQGKSFLGPVAGSPREYIFGASSRVDEAYEVSRCVRDKRYKYIRNYMPHLPYIQPSEYPDRAEIMQELRRVVAEENLTDVQKLHWTPTKPLEELYDTLADRHEINNLAKNPKARKILERMRRVHRGWMVGTHDTGLLSEAEMHIRSEGSTPYEMAQQISKYPQWRILDAADLVGRGPSSLPKMIRLSSSSDSAVRYWSIVALSVSGSGASQTVKALTDRLEDSSPNVRLAAAGALCKLGMCDNALPVLVEGLAEQREETALFASREIQNLGSKARPIVQQMKDARRRYTNADGTPINNNHAMFIDWALKNALESCVE
ncbi:MAG: sulfatase-like hydrolase/transferase [Planctomycetes bacterium]|nr:sulfatase-like hydrolase/transferase [Planctomycetota bacterium]